MSLDLDQSEEHGATVLRVAGRVDSSNARDFEAAALAAIEAGEGPMVFEMSGLSYMSSAGLRVLLVALKAGKPKARRICLAAVQDNVGKVLQMSGFDAMFSLGDTVEEAASA